MTYLVLARMRPWFVYMETLRTRGCCAVAPDIGSSYAVLLTEVN